MLRRMTLLLMIVVAVAFGPVIADDLAVKVTVSEPAGVARAGEPAGGGVPFFKGQVKDVADLKLLDASGKPVLAGFSKLAGYDDGTVQWALVETTAVNLPANGTAQFTVVPGKYQPSELPFSVSETDKLISISGGYGVRIDKDSRGFLRVAQGAALSNVQFKLTDADGKEYSADQPRSVTFDRRTPTGVVIRIDGDYVDADGKPWLGYTVRVSAWAYTGRVRITHSIRNSAPDNGFDAKIRAASLVLPMPPEAKEQSAGPNWTALTAVENQNVLVVTRHAGGCFPGGSSYANTRAQTLYKQTLEEKNRAVEVFLIPPGDTPPSAKAGGMFGYDKDKQFFALADLAHKDTEVWLDFNVKADDKQAVADRVKALLCPLHVLADPEWISRTETLGSGRFGTLADEIATYKLWGWKGADDAKKQPRLAHVPDAYVASESIHGESEADNAEAFVMMYVRTGDRGYLDWARAWAEFGKTHYAYRTDGFAYQGKARKTTGLQVGWYGPKEYGWSDSRSEYCHFYGRGIFDYYCLTGDAGALEGGRDLVEEVAEWAKKYTVGGAIGYYGVRGFARDWLAAIRLAQLTRDPADRKLADQMAEVVFKASDWDPRGFVFWGAGPSYMAARQFAPANMPAKAKEYMAANSITIDKNGIVTNKAGDKWPLRSDGGTWQQVTLGMALERYYRLTGSEQAKAMAIQMAKFARDYQISKKCEYAFYYTILDFPEKDRVYDMADWDDAHKVCPTGEGPKHDGHYMRFFPDVFARTYTLTGEKAWLDLARKAWNRGSKRGYQAIKPFAADDEVGTFANNEAPKSDTVLSTCRMFFEVPRAK